MKFLLLALLLLAPVSAHTIAEEVLAGPYTVQLSTVPGTLEAGQATILITVLREGEPITNEDVFVRLSDKKKVYLAGTFRTDYTGTIPISYYFNGPGTYAVTVEVRGEAVDIPLHVHGQYVLLFGFLAAVFIALALLFDSKGGPAKGF